MKKRNEYVVDKETKQNFECIITKEFGQKAYMERISIRTREEEKEEVHTTVWNREKKRNSFELRLYKIYFGLHCYYFVKQK